MRYLFLLAALLLAVGSPLNVVYSADWFVSGSGSDGNSGTSAGDAFRTISQAMSAASDGDTIHVAAGTYNSAAGESFPIVLKDGVSILGPGDGSASVIADGGGGIQPPETNLGLGLSGALIVNSLSGTVAVEGLEISASIYSACIAANLGIGAILGPVNNGTLIVRGNQLLGGSAGVAFFASNNSASLFVSSNSIFGSGSALAETAPLLFGGGVFAMYANSFSFSAVGDASNHFEIHSNVIADHLAGIMIAPLVGTASIDIQNNQISDGQFGIFVFSLAFLFLKGIPFFAGKPGGTMYINAYLQGQIRGNDITDNGSVGIAHWLLGGVFVDTTTTSTCTSAARTELGKCTTTVTTTYIFTNDIDIDIRFNELIGNGSAGLAWFAGISMSTIGKLETLGPATTFVSIGGEVEGNVIVDNDGAGVVIFASSSGVVGVREEVSIPYFDIRPNFGDGVELLRGRNTIQDNLEMDRIGKGGPPFPVSDQFILSGTSGFCISALGNFWGTTDVSAIEDHVYHTVDTSGVGLVKFDASEVAPLAPELNVIANITQVKNIGGEEVSVTGTQFVPFAGNQPIIVTLGGIPVVNPVVDETFPSLAGGPGGRLTFTAPFGISLGPQSLIITNPGGQTGTILFTVTPAFFVANASRCFIATASFGDEDAPEVLVLRRLRDEHLADNVVGRKFVEAYYALSPPLAEVIADRPWAQSVSRAALAPVVGAARLWIEHQWFFLGGLAAGAWFLLRRKK